MDPPGAFQAIRKHADVHGIEPNMRDYASERASFTWGNAASALDGLPFGHGINIAHQAVDRHALGSRADHLALRWLGRDGRSRDYTYRDLRDLTNRFANVLRSLELRPGARVFVLAGRIPELYVSVLGALKNKNIACTLFSAFGPEPIHTRMEIGEADVLVTTRLLYERKVAALRPRLPHLHHVLVVPDGAGVPENTLDFWALMKDASEQFHIPPTSRGTAAELTPERVSLSDP